MVANVCVNSVTTLNRQLLNSSTDQAQHVPEGQKTQTGELAQTLSRGKKGQQLEGVRKEKYRGQHRLGIAVNNVCFKMNAP